MNQIPNIPDNAPFSQEQRAWLNGLLAAMFPGGIEGVAKNASPLKPVKIVFASQTGNSEGLAKQMSKRAKTMQLDPKVLDMSDYSIEELKQDEDVLLIASTYGEGEPPDTAVPFWENLTDSNAPKLDNTNYAILALGDSNYPDFCEFGIQLDKRFQELGAKQIKPRVDCDVDFEEPFENWSQSVLSSISNTAINDEIKDSKVEMEDLVYNKKNPFPASISDNYDLNLLGSKKETRHIEIDISGSDLHYDAGDAIGIFSKNCPDLAQEIVSVNGFKGTEELKSNNGETKTLLEILIEDCDITSLNKKFIQNYNESANSKELETLLNQKEALSDFLLGREPIDLFVQFPTNFSNPADLTGLFKKINPRLYSIASSALKHPDKVQLTVGIVRYNSHNRNRKGVCSTYLADRAENQKLGVFIHPNKSFKVPEDSKKPMIMVGPGTGIAPFRAFLQERYESKATGKNWLFFGDQHAATDFIYEDEITEYQKLGFLQKLDLAFSRDQADKIYVQDKMLENGEELYRWLEEGSYFFVCGDASRMAKDVDKTLQKVIKIHGNCTDEEALQYIKELKSNKRYVRDVY
jgi:sulfite reductase (NADPH) flavoprotein alpha-component